MDCTCSKKKLRHVAVRNEGSKFFPKSISGKGGCFCLCTIQVLSQSILISNQHSFRVELCTVYLGAPEWVYRWFEAGRSLIEKKSSVMPSCCSMHSQATSHPENEMRNRTDRDLKRYSVSHWLVARFPLPNLLLTDITLIVTFLLISIYPELLAIT